MSRKLLYFFIYTLFICLLSIGCTVAYYQYVVLDSGAESLIQMDEGKVSNSPLKDSDVLVEIMSYGCHFCAINDKAITELETRLPQGVRVVRLHLENTGSRGLARYARLFATLQVMGIEPQYREKVYAAIIDDNKDLSDNIILNRWLSTNSIDVEKYHAVEASQETRDLIKYMNDVSHYYDVTATPAFIVNKKWVAFQDRDFDKFGDHLLSLLKNNKPLEQ